jgi:hypothetical protein
MYYEDEILGCAYACPWQIRDQICPLNEIEHLSFREKLIWLKGISKEEKESIIKHHLFCTKNRKQ